MNDEFENTATKYQLNLFDVLDTSGSMYGERINQLNVAMAEACQVAEDAAMEKEVQLKMRVVDFNSTAKWIYGDTQQGVEHIDWQPLSAGGGTDTAAAIDLVTGCMHREYLGERNYKPVVILITDGESNDTNETKAAINRLKTSLKSTKNPNADKIIRIAIGVSGANQAELLDFASVGNIKHDDGTIDENVPFVFNVDDIQMLKSLLKGVTVSSIASSVGAGVDGNGNDVPVIETEVEDKKPEDWEE